MLTIEELREMIKLIDKSSIDEFIYESNGEKIVLKKSDPGKLVTLPAEVQQPVSDRPESLKGGNSSEEAELVEPGRVHPAQSTVDYDYEIVSPMVGTLYHAPSPDSEPYVTVGSLVSKDSIVCIVEAMKLFNEIEAEINGEIVEVLVENGELVEYGQPLFRVKTR